MSTCLITEGRIEPCKDSVGGLTKVYFANFGTLGAITYTNPGSSAQITSFASGTVFEYDLKGTSSFDQTITSSRDNGTTFYDQLLNLTFHKLDYETNDQIALIATARPHAIVEDNNGNLFVAGLEYGMDCNGGTIVTGAAMGDLSGYTLTMQGMEKLPANFIAGDIASTGLTVSSDQIEP
tara:strand:+ start:11925 stop:12464 length:540 start_codon:yes stop_codon:yes gene_type:complete